MSKKNFLIELFEEQCIKGEPFFKDVETKDGTINNCSSFEINLEKIDEYDLFEDDAHLFILEIFDMCYIGFNTVLCKISKKEFIALLTKFTERKKITDLENLKITRSDDVETLSKLFIQKNKQQKRKVLTEKR